jgi:hypothetical protein
VYIGVASYILIIYGIKFGPEANDWLQACGISVVQDLFVNSPGGFIAKTILLVLILEFLEAVFFRSAIDVTKLFTIRRRTKTTVDVPNFGLESPVPIAELYHAPVIEDDIRLETARSTTRVQDDVFVTDNITPTTPVDISPASLPLPPPTPSEEKML